MKQSLNLILFCNKFSLLIGPLFNVNGIVFAVEFQTVKLPPVFLINLVENRYMAHIEKDDN